MLSVEAGGRCTVERIWTVKADGSYMLGTYVGFELY